MDKETKKRIIKALECERLTLEDILRKNAIRLAKNHKKHCKGENCSISLALLRELLRGKHKINLTEEEERVFL